MGHTCFKKSFLGDLSNSMLVILEELLRFKICLKEGKQPFFPMDGIRHEACAVQHTYKCARKGWELLSLEIIQNYSG